MEVRSIVGARARLEDAWHLGTLDWRGQPFAAAAVFDGVAGMPHGREAAWAAADALPSVLAAAEGFDDVLPGLGRAAAGARGGSTGIVALSPHTRPGQVALACVGDSVAYTLDAGDHLMQVSPRDVAAPDWLTDYLGNPDLHGHVLGVEIRRGGALLLATDGIEVVPDDLIEGTLAAPPGAQEAALDLLFEAILDAGAPDNATALLARRDG